METQPRIRAYVVAYFHRSFHYFIEEIINPYTNGHTSAVMIYV